MKRILFYSSMIVGIVVVTIVSIELILRLMGAGFNYVYSRESPASSVSADIRIMCVGESTTWGVGASDESRFSYPVQLEKMLEETYPNLSFSCFTDQTIGQNTQEILDKMPRYMARYRPHIVIIMCGANNFWNMDRRSFLIFNKSETVSDFSLAAYMFIKNLRVYKLYRYITLVSGVYKGRYDFWFPVARKSIEDFEREALDDVYGLELFRKIAQDDISQMVTVCREFGARPFIASYPAHDRNYLAQYVAAKETGTYFINVAGFLENHKPRSEYFAEDNWHPNDAGYTVVATMIHDVLVTWGDLEGLVAQNDSVRPFAK